MKFLDIDVMVSVVHKLQTSRFRSSGNKNNSIAHVLTLIKEAIGAEKVLDDVLSRQAFETDALTAYRVKPQAILLPETTEDVSKALAILNRHNIQVVPRGAGTSLAGGALPHEESVVLCISKMNKMLELDFANRAARVQSGMTNLAISDLVRNESFFYAPDPSSQLSCTIAGNIAMNSGGAHCLKYGVTTHNLLGLTMVLMDGQVIEIGGPHFDSAGYDLLALITGSEGQLGIVTEAVVQLIPNPEGAKPMLIGFDKIADAGHCVAAIIAEGIIPVAIEFMDKPAIHFCEDFAHAGYPLDAEAMLIIEVEGSEAEIETQLLGIRKIAKEFNPSTIEISSSEADSIAIWKGRKSAFGAVGRVNDYMCMDGVIPLAMLSEVLEKISEICSSYGFKVANIFHAGDGNLHPLILYDANKKGEIEKVEKCGAEILKLCVLAGGCLTGEHGVGIEKRDLMSYQYNDLDLANQMRLKTIFDPDWLLNQEKVFPLDKRPLSQL